MLFRRDFRKSGTNTVRGAVSRLSTSQKVISDILSTEETTEPNEAPPPVPTTQTQRKPGETAHAFLRRLKEETAAIQKRKNSGAVVETQDFMEMKSNKVMSKPRLDEYIHALCHKPFVDQKKIEKMFKTQVHARLVAKAMSRKGV